MIHITEQKAQKVPGLTSFFVSFDYNQYIVDLLKTIQNCNYDKKTKVWEMPLLKLSLFLDYACQVDEIELRLLDTSIDNTDVYIQDTTNQVQLFKHQVDAVNFGLQHDKWLLLDAPGLGKTLSLIRLAEQLHQRDNIQHCLIVCGINTLKANWKREIEKFSQLDAMILGQRTTRTGKQVIEGVSYRIKQLQEKIDQFFVILNVESLRSDQLQNLLMNGPNKFDLIIVDEIHTCFDYNTLVTTNQGQLRIGDIVTQNIDCCVLSYNHETGCSEYKPILSRFVHTSTSLLQLQFDNGGEQLVTLTCTPDHKIFTKNRGYVAACELTSEDEVLVNA